MMKTSDLDALLMMALGMNLESYVESMVQEGEDATLCKIFDFQANNSDIDLSN